MKPLVLSLFAEGTSPQAQFTATWFDDVDQAAHAASRFQFHVPRSHTLLIDEHGEIPFVISPMPIKQIRDAVAKEVA